jgi:hypothetical protein
MLAAIRRASSRVSKLAAVRRSGLILGAAPDHRCCFGLPGKVQQSRPPLFSLHDQ